MTWLYFVWRRSPCSNSFFFFFPVSLHSTWDLSFPTRDWTCSPCIGSTESLSLDHQGSPYDNSIFHFSRSCHPVFLPVAVGFYPVTTVHIGLPRWPGGKEATCQCRRRKSYRFNPWVWKTPWRRKWQPTPVLLPGEFHAQRSLAGYSPWGHRQSDTTEWLNNSIVRSPASLPALSSHPNTRQVVSHCSSDVHFLHD